MRNYLVEYTQDSAQVNFLTPYWSLQTVGLTMRTRLEETKFVLPFSVLNFLQMICSLIVTLNCLFSFIEIGFYTLPAYYSQALSNYFENVRKHTLLFRFFLRLMQIFDVQNWNCLKFVRENKFSSSHLHTGNQMINVLLFTPVVEQIWQNESTYLSESSPFKY